MKRPLFLCTLLGLAAIVVAVGYGAPALWPSTGSTVQPLLHARTGGPLTLETVVNELAWRRETARKLQRFD